MPSTDQATLSPSVLIVDDTGANLVALAAVLRPIGVRIVEASSGEEALARVRTESFAAALLDVQMPGMDGFELAKRMRELKNGRELPVIFVTAIHRDEAFIRKGYALGAADYVTKPFDIEVLRSRVRAFVELFQQREDVRRTQVAAKTSERDEALRRVATFEQLLEQPSSRTTSSCFWTSCCRSFWMGPTPRTSPRSFCTRATRCR